MTTKHYHFIGIGGIGISALARYHHLMGDTISATDMEDFPMIRSLRDEGIDTIIGVDEYNLPIDSDVVVYSTAHANHPEVLRAKSLGMRVLTYPEALAEVVNAKKCIAITGSHGKSTTTAMTGVMLAGSAVGGSTLVGTQVPQLGGSNIHIEDSPYFAIEACEYKRAFLEYRPYITVITNIDLDHLDYYRDLDDYISAFQTLVNQTSGYVIYDMDDTNARKLDFSQTSAKPIRINHSGWYDENPTPIPPTPLSQGGNNTSPRPLGEGLGVRADEMRRRNYFSFPEMNLQVPGDHLLFDAKLAFTVGKLLGLENNYIANKLESYTGCWRRSEIVRTTSHGNILMSDYGHHPTEIRLTLEAIRGKYPDKKLFVAFQPHQHSRTRELLPEFVTAFDPADMLIVPDIYFSRDSEEDVAYMTTERFVDTLRVRYPFVRNGEGLERTAERIREYDAQNPDSSIILLLGAGDIDGLREEIL